MNQASNLWGVELSGADVDKKIWRMLLKPPSEPFVEEVKDERGDYLVLRSTTFDGVSSSEEVCELAKQLFKLLNMVMLINGDTDSVTNGAVVEFVPNSQPRKHRYLEAEAGSYRLRGFSVKLTVTDAQGNIIERPPAPSRAQLWMRAVSLKPEIGSALRYLKGNPGWVELYKAYEAVQQMPKGDISKDDIRRFTQTANVGERHHPNNKHKPHARPMDLVEGRTLIIRWVTVAIEDILAKNQ